ncbi:hypothetical protein, partial [Rothia sp. ND6WE1A]|uniref:hypothetical protein n=1 Tax=Rothia sp. ND6WE1A TaxID=1848190 RepID=UPI001E3412BD
VKFNYPTIPRIWRHASNHITIDIPSQLNISEIYFEEGIDNSYYMKNEQRVKFLFPSKPSVRFDSFDLIQFSCTVIPIKPGVRTWSAWAILILFILMTISLFVRIGGLAHNSSNTFEVPNSSIGIVTSAASLILVLIAKDAEHPYIRLSLSPYRTSVAWTALALFLLSLLASIPIIEPIWNFAWMLVYIISSIAVIIRLITFLQLPEPERENNIFWRCIYFYFKNLENNLFPKE